MNGIDEILDEVRPRGDGQQSHDPLALAFNIRTFLLGQKGDGARAIESIYYYGAHRTGPLCAILIASGLYYLVMVATFEGTTRSAFIAGAVGNAVCMFLVLLLERCVRMTVPRRLLLKETIVVAWMLLTLFWLYRGVVELIHCSQGDGKLECMPMPAMGVALLLPSMCWHRTAHPRWQVLQACASVVVIFVVANGTSTSGRSVLRSHSSFVVTALLQISCATSSWLGSRAAFEGIGAAHQSGNALSALKARVDSVLPRMVDVSVCEVIRWRRHWVSTYAGDAVLMYCCLSTPSELRHDPLETWLWVEAVQSHLGDAMQSTLGSAAGRTGGGCSTVVGANGDLLFAVLCSRDGEALHINAKSIKAFLRQIARFQGSLVRLDAHRTTRMVVHRGFVSCLCLGEQSVQVQPMGTVVAEATLAVPLCTLGALCATSCVANSVSDVWTSSTPLGTVTPKINPIAFQVVELTLKTTHPHGVLQPPTASAPLEASPKDAPSSVTAANKKPNREKGVTIVSVAEQEERQTILSQSNGLDALIALSGRHPTHAGGSGTSVSMCRPHGVAAAGYRTMRQTAEALCTPRFPHGIDFRAHDAGRWGYLEQPYWSHYERASYRQRLVALFVCTGISSFLTASTTSDADRPYHVVRLLLCAAGAITDVTVLFLSLHNSPLHKRHTVLVALHGAAWCCIYASMSLRETTEMPMLEVVALIRIAAFLNGFCLQVRWWLPTAAVVLGMYLPVVVRSALMVPIQQAPLCIGFSLLLAPLLPLPWWSLSDARAAFLRSYISWVASDDMTRGLTAERKCLSTVLGKTQAEHVLRQGLQLHAPRLYPRAIVLAVALPQICLPSRQDPQRGVPVLHQLRRTLDHIGQAYGCELLTPCYGDVLVYINYYGEVYSPQLNVRRIKAASMHRKKPHYASAVPPRDAHRDLSPHEVDDDATPLPLSEAVCWNVRLSMEMWASMSRCVQSVLRADGESSGTPSNVFETQGSDVRMPPTRSESVLQSELTASMSTRHSSSTHLTRSEAINTCIGCVDVGHLRCGISSMGGERLVLGAGGRPLGAVLRLVREPSWCTTGGVPVLRVPTRIEAQALPELGQPLAPSQSRVTLYALPHGQCLELQQRLHRSRPPASVLKGEFEAVPCEIVDECIPHCTSLSILVEDSNDSATLPAATTLPAPSVTSTN